MAGGLILIGREEVEVEVGESVFVFVKRRGFRMADLQHCDQRGWLIDGVEDSPDGCGFPWLEAHLADGDLGHPASAFGGESISFGMPGKRFESLLEKVKPAVGEVGAAMGLMGFIPLELTLDAVLGFR